jgi:hypothetical protein
MAAKILLKFGIFRIQAKIASLLGLLGLPYPEAEATVYQSPALAFAERPAPRAVPDYGMNADTIGSSVHAKV